MKADTQTNNENTETLIEFPCEFPLKVMGRNHETFAHEMCELIAAYVNHDVPHDSVICRPSSSGKYSAITITITAESKAQLDKIYLALYEHDDVKMTL